MTGLSAQILTTGAGILLTFLLVGFFVGLFARWEKQTKRFEKEQQAHRKQIQTAHNERMREARELTRKKEQQLKQIRSEKKEMEKYIRELKLRLADKKAREVTQQNVTTQNPSQYSQKSL